MNGQVFYLYLVVLFFLLPFSVAERSCPEDLRLFRFRDRRSPATLQSGEFVRPCRPS
jgi:hypothetical protein